MIFILVCCFSFFSMAQVQVQVIDPHLDIKGLEEKGYDVTNESKDYSALPDKSQRDEILNSIPQTKGWDQVERDIFYMNLRSKSINELKMKYPSIPEHLLKKLKVQRD